MITYDVPSYSQLHTTYIEQLTKAASDARMIFMYYTPYTDATFDSDSAMKKEALYTISIDCYLNCDMFLKNIVKQFSQAKKMVCPSTMGNRYLLIELKGKELDIDINYLKGGNVIIYNNKCFYNKKSIDKVVPSPNIFDGMLRDEDARSGKTDGGK
ncbi:MAG: hypothetical protein ACRDHZ_05630 [Ktedonobacteraceae bacterium]